MKVVKSKLVIPVLTLLCILGATAFSADDLVLYLSFDQGTISNSIATDLSGHGNDGIISGDPKVVDGILGDALELKGDGSDDRVEVPLQPSITFGQGDSFSALAWIKTGVTTSQQDGIVGNYGTKAAQFWHLFANEDGGVTFYVRDVGKAHSAVVASPDLISDGIWHHVAGIRDQHAKKVRLYIDGELVNELDDETEDINSGQSIWIGDTLSRYFDGLMDDVRIYNKALDQAAILRAMKGTTATELASAPTPADGGDDVLRDDVTLEWTAGEFAATHDLYMGDSFEDVNDATVPTAAGLDANSFDLGRLEFGKTVFWRVDEVNGTPDKTVFKGDVWSFEVEPYSIPIAGSEIIATASSASNEESLPENTLNGSGLDANDMHTITTETMWFTAMGDATPWIQYEFDGVKKLDTMTVWNSNSSAEGFIGYGVKGVLIEYSVDGQTWDVFEDVNEFSRAPGLRTYNQYDEINLAGLAAKMVRLNIQSNWGGVMQSYGLSEVQFSMIPTAARTPEPESESVNILPDAVLSWRAGREAAQSTVYVSTDPNEVADGIAASAISNTNRLNLSAFDAELGQTYYWRVYEVNEAEVESVWAGPVWSLSTPEALIVDDFESYGNFSPDRPFQTWLDGAGYSADEFFPVAYGGNGTGAAIGHDIWTVSSPHFDGTIMETSITAPGSSQAMPFNYTNTGGVASEAQRTFTAPMDWTASGIKSLSLMFYGDPDNSGQLYVKINDTKVPYNGDVADIARAEWQAWIIDLSAVGGNLQNVTSLAIGVEGAGAAGMLVIDEIRLYPKAAEYITPIEPDTANLAGHWNFDEGSGATAVDVSGNGNPGTLVNTTWQAGKMGSALKFDGASAYVDIPGAAWSTISQQATISAWLHIDSSVTQTPHTFSAFNNETKVASAYAVWNNGNIYFDSGDRISKGVQPGEYADAWIHWAFIKNADTGEQKIYRNGILWHSGTGMTSPMAGDTVTRFTLGTHANHEDNPTNFWNGVMDDFRLYNKELSQEEILWLANRTEPLVKPF
jgi:hypothetical protein